MSIKKFGEIKISYLGTEPKMIVEHFEFEPPYRKLPIEEVGDYLIDEFQTLFNDMGLKIVRVEESEE